MKWTSLLAQGWTKIPGAQQPPTKQWEQYINQVKALSINNTNYYISCVADLYFNV